jgi:hypothetical protein
MLVTQSEQENINMDSNIASEARMKLLASRYYENNFLSEGKDTFVLLWNDSSTRCVQKERLLPSIEYFMNNISRIADPRYIPTKLDILHARVRYKDELTIEIKNKNIFFGKTSIVEGSDLTM